MLRNIELYQPHLNGTGQMGVLRLTGPIAYSLAIHPLISDSLSRVIDTRESGLEYSIFAASDHSVIFKYHYVSLTSSIIKRRGMMDFRPMQMKSCQFVGPLDLLNRHRSSTVASKTILARQGS